MGVRDGILLVDKPAGMSSHAVVARARRALGVRRVGHAGTLDPAATGLLVLGVGAGTRLLTFLVGLDKTYDATIRLGVATSTEDAEGDIVAEPGCVAGVDPRPAMRGLTGNLMQRPSAVSAIKVDGKRAYQRVRSGEVVELPARPVQVRRFELMSITAGSLDRSGESAPHDSADGRGVAVLDLEVVAEVSSGTYIRALARDLGESLGTAGHLTRLRRTRVGPFTVDSAIDLESIGAAGQTAGHMPMGAAAAAALPTVTCHGDQVRAVSHGQKIAADGAADDALCALLDPSGDLLAVAAPDAEGNWKYAMVVPHGASATLERP